MDPKKQDQDPNAASQKTAMEGITATLNELKASLLASETANKELQAKLQAKDQQKVDDAKKAADAKLDNDADITALLADLDKKPDNKAGDLDSMSNKELIDVIAAAMDTTITANMTKLQQAIGEQQEGVDKKLLETQNALGQFIVKQGIDDMSKNNPEFDELKPAIAENLKKYPGIDITVAFKLAKADMLEKAPAPEQVFSERPGEELSVHGLPLVKRTKNETFDNKGIRGFRNAFEAAFDRLHP